MEIMKCNTVHLGLKLTFNWWLKSSVCPLTGGQSTGGNNRIQYGTSRCWVCWMWKAFVMFCALSFLALDPLAYCLCAPEGVERKDSAALQGKSWGGTSQSVLWNKPLSKACRCVPVRLSSDKRAVTKKWGDLRRRQTLVWSSREFCGTLRMRLLVADGFNEQRWGHRRGQKNSSRPCRKVSDQCPRLGLVFSVPLHICQLWTNRAAEKAAVTKRPAKEDKTVSLIVAAFIKLSK